MRGWLIYLRQWFSYSISLPQGQSYTERKERFTPLILWLKTKRLTSFALKRKANSQSKVNESSKGGYPYLYPTHSAIVISPVDNRRHCRRWIAGYPAIEQPGPDVKKTCECFRALLNSDVTSPGHTFDTWSLCHIRNRLGRLGTRMWFNIPFKGIQDSLGFRIPGSESEFFVSGTWLPDSSRWWDTGFLELHLDSKSK